jgi:hypothetical protein
MGEVVDRLRPQLRTFRGERGQEFVDLPDAPRPDEDTPGPVRFLPEYDNALLSHADRSRFVTEKSRELLRQARGPSKGSVLVDGEVRAIWHTEAEPGRGAVLVVEHDRLARRARLELEREAGRVAAFWFTDATDRRVRLVPVA